MAKPLMNIKPGRIGCGVYIVRNLVTGHCYIGMSYAIGERMRMHYNQLMNGRHPNRLINAALKKNGAGAFAIEILELVPEHDVVRREAELQEQYQI